MMEVLWTCDDYLLRRRNEDAKWSDFTSHTHEVSENVTRKELLLASGLWSIDKRMSFLPKLRDHCEVAPSIGVPSQDGNVTLDALRRGAIAETVALVYGFCP